MCSHSASRFEGHHDLIAHGVAAKDGAVSGQNGNALHEMGSVPLREVEQQSNVKQRQFGGLQPAAQCPEQLVVLSGSRLLRDDPDTAQ